MNYGEALKTQREIQGLTKTELAKAIKTSHQNITRWEEGNVLPNIDFCVRLADFYGITLDELVGRDRIITPSSAQSSEQAPGLDDIVDV